MQSDRCRSVPGVPALTSIKAQVKLKSSPTRKVWTLVSAMGSGHHQWLQHYDYYRTITLSAGRPVAM